MQQGVGFKTNSFNFSNVLFVVISSQLKNPDYSQSALQ